MKSKREPDWAALHLELKKKHMTKQLLWDGNEPLKARRIDRGDRGETRVLARQFEEGPFPSRPCDVDDAIRFTIAHAAPGGLVLQ